MKQLSYFPHAGLVAQKDSSAVSLVFELGDLAEHL